MSKPKQRAPGAGRPRSLKEPKSTITVYLPVSEIDRLRAQAAADERGLSLSAWVAHLLETYC